MLFAAVRRFAAAPLRGALASAPAVGAGGLRVGAPQARGFAAAVTSPRPLSIRMDSLFVKCFIAAVIYFGPQDTVFLSGLFWVWHTQAAAISPKKCQKDASAALEEFKAKKGLEDVKVAKGRSTWKVALA